VRVLHLFADWKWTGPAEPTLDLCLELRALGVEVTLACRAAPPSAQKSLPHHARERDLEPLHDFGLTLSKTLSDIRKIAEVSRDYDIVHTHFSHDHFVGGRGARRGGHAKIFRTNHKAVPTRKTLASSHLFRKLTDGYLTASCAALEADTARFGVRGWHVDPCMRLDRFTPREAPHEDFVVGVVARMQRHRRFDVLLEGVRLAKVPDLRVVIVGRGTHRNEVAIEPARRMGLTNVSFPGYLEREAYLDTLAGFDALLFLVPGSDGTCRAIREAMAMGKAIIGARRGMIPELVDDGITGLVVDDTPENLARAIERLAADREACREMGRRGRQKALERYAPRRHAEAVRDAYATLL
jgi:glycosyltransferase involved in cell wall biosynthesis